MRVFYGVKFTEETNRKIKKYRDAVAKNSLQGKFTSQNNFHLTLVFIGEVSSDQIDTLAGILDTAVTHNPVVSQFCATHIGTFKKRNKDIIWLGIEDVFELFKLQNALDQSLVDLTFNKEIEPYVPHITLGRQIVLKEENASIIGKISEAFPLYAESLCLYESKRIDEQLIYEPIHTINLR